MALTEEQFYSLWERFAESNIIECLPDDIEEECERLEITVDYYIQEFMWLYKNKNFNSYRAALELSYGIKSQSDKELKILNIAWFNWLLSKRELVILSPAQ